MSFFLDKLKVCAENYYFFFSGTFARVCLCRHKTSSNFFALKILSLHDVIRLKQVDHVKNEKNILKVPLLLLLLLLLSQG